MKKPIVGISPLFDINLQSIWMYDGYFEAIEDAGGIPVMLSKNNGQYEIDRLLEVVDAIVLPGGKDVDPLYYGEAVSKHCGPIIPALDKADIMLARSGFERNIPVLGLCRGSQVINVAMGGTLYQDISAQTERSTPILHDQKGIMPKDHPIHSVRLSVKSRLYECFGCDSIMTNSFHHQASKDIGTGMFASAYAEDGIVEAVECNSKDHFLLGVQWHPELMFKRDDNARKLFLYFIEKAKDNIR